MGDRQGSDGTYAPIDGSAQVVEFFLIVGHDAADTIGMEITGDLRELEPNLGELEQGPLKQVMVVCLEVDLTLPGKDLTVAQKKIRMGQAALGVPVAGPGITEIDVDAIHLAGGEEFGQAGGVAVDKEDIVQIHGAYPLHGDDHSVRHPFHRNVEGLRILCGGLGSKTPLTAAQFQVENACLGHQAHPAAPQGGRIRDQNTGTPLHPGGQVGLFSHSHRFIHLTKSIITYLIGYLQSLAAYIIMISVMQVNHISGCSEGGIALDLGGYARAVPQLHIGVLRSW